MGKVILLPSAVINYNSAESCSPPSLMREYDFDPNALRQTLAGPSICLIRLKLCFKTSAVNVSSL